MYGDLKVLVGTHETKPVRLLGGEVGHDKHTFYLKKMRGREEEKKRGERGILCLVLKVSLCPCHILSFNLSHLTFNVFPSDRKLFEKSGHQILSHRYTLVPILLLNSYF